MNIRRNNIKALKQQISCYEDEQQVDVINEQRVSQQNKVSQQQNFEPQQKRFDPQQKSYESQQKSYELQQNLYQGKQNPQYKQQKQQHESLSFKQEVQNEQRRSQKQPKNLFKHYKTSRSPPLSLFFKHHSLNDSWNKISPSTQPFLQSSPPIISPIFSHQNQPIISPIYPPTCSSTSPSYASIPSSTSINSPSYIYSHPSINLANDSNRPLISSTQSQTKPPDHFFSNSTSHISNYLASSSNVYCTSLISPSIPYQNHLSCYPILQQTSNVNLSSCRKSRNDPIIYSQASSTNNLSKPPPKTSQLTLPLNQPQSTAIFPQNGSSRASSYAPFICTPTSKPPLASSFVYTSCHLNPIQSNSKSLSSSLPAIENPIPTSLSVQPFHQSISNNSSSSKPLLHPPNLSAQPSHNSKQLLNPKPQTPNLSAIREHRRSFCIENILFQSQSRLDDDRPDSPETFPNSKEPLLSQKAYRPTSLEPSKSLPGTPTTSCQVPFNQQKSQTSLQPQLSELASSSLIMAASKLAASKSALKSCSNTTATRLTSLPALAIGQPKIVKNQKKSITFKRSFSKSRSKLTSCSDCGDCVQGDRSDSDVASNAALVAAKSKKRNKPSTVGFRLGKRKVSLYYLQLFFFDIFCVCFHVFLSSHFDFNFLDVSYVLVQTYPSFCFEMRILSDIIKLAIYGFFLIFFP